VVRSDGPVRPSVRRQLELFQRSPSFGMLVMHALGVLVTSAWLRWVESGLCALVRQVAGRVSRAAAPRELRVVDALPLLASGKLDRRALLREPR